MSMCLQWKLSIHWDVSLQRRHCNNVSSSGVGGWGRRVGIHSNLVCGFQRQLESSVSCDDFLFLHSWKGAQFLCMCLLLSGTAWCKPTISEQDSWNATKGLVCAIWLSIVKSSHVASMHSTGTFVPVRDAKNVFLWQGNLETQLTTLANPVYSEDNPTETNHLHSSHHRLIFSPFSQSCEIN